eukprot:2854007-Amphidinium_carterae.2
MSRSKKNVSSQTKSHATQLWRRTRKMSPGLDLSLPIYKRQLGLTNGRDCAARPCPSGCSTD